MQSSALPAVLSLSLLKNVFIDGFSYTIRERTKGAIMNVSNAMLENLSAVNFTLEVTNTNYRLVRFLRERRNLKRMSE